mgnify:CR=1 FL=1
MIGIQDTEDFINETERTLFNKVEEGANEIVSHYPIEPMKMRDTRIGTIGHVDHGKTTLQAAITSVLAKKGFDKDEPLLIIPGHTGMNKSVDLARRIAELEKEHPGLVVIDGDQDLEMLQGVIHDNSELKNRLRETYLEEHPEKMEFKITRTHDYSDELVRKEETFKISKHHNKAYKPRKKVKRNTCKKRK